MTTIQPDLFTNVHKGIRRALFEATLALGRAADDDEAQGRAARAKLGEALRFVAHHGDNEDLLLLPLLERRVPAISARMIAAHAQVGASLDALVGRVEGAPIAALYLETGAFVALYLEHMREEEQELDRAIREAIPADELAAFGRGSVERTAPADQRMMLGWMLPAMTRVDVEAFFARLPAGVADGLRSLVG